MKKKNKKMGNTESVTSQPIVEGSIGGNEATQGGFKATYQRFKVTFNILFICLFCLFTAFSVYFGLMWGTRHGRAIVVPNFIEMSLEDARKLADELDLEIVVRDSLHEDNLPGGLVIDQMPAPSNVREVTVKPDRKIYLLVNAYARTQVRVPYVGHVSVKQAINQLEREGFQIEELIYRPHHHSELVLDQSVNGITITRTSNVTMPHGSGVKLTVGYREGKQLTSVPRLMGMHLHQAKTALWQNGLNLNKVVYDESVKDLKSRRLARVYMQTQPAKKGVVRGTMVSLYLTCDETLVDSLSKISDKNQKYLDEQRKLMEKEAQEEARLKEEAEAKRREEEERRNAEAAAALEGKETFDGAVQVYGGEAEAKAAAAAIAAEKEASKAEQGADSDIIDE